MSGRHSSGEAGVGPDLTVRIGPATLRNPVQLAHAWSTLDVLSGGRMVMGACAGNVVEDAYQALMSLGGVAPALPT